jgi:hypothetical protein
MRARILSGIASLAIGVVTVGFTCYGTDASSNCEVHVDDTMHSAGITISHNLPGACPIKLWPSELPAGRMTYFEATLEGPGSRIESSGELQFVDRYNSTTRTASVIWNQNPFGSPTKRATPSGWYHAGSGGVSSYGTIELDAAFIHQTLTGPFALAEADISLPYLVMAPQPVANDVAENTPFVVSITVDDPTAVLPLKYQWFQNNVALGPPTQGWDVLSVGGQAGGTSLDYYVIITDATNHSVTSEMRNVWVFYGNGCDDPDNCPP